jgi:hypothetical protein
MPQGRDPLSVRYDAVARDVLLRAARASRNRAGVRAWIASPRAEFRDTDKSGRTAHERAFTRSAYYIIFKNFGESGRSGWALKLTWGTDADRRPSSAGRLARPVVIRLFPAGQAAPVAPRWVGTSRQSVPGNRAGE